MHRPESARWDWSFKFEDSLSKQPSSVGEAQQRIGVLLSTAPGERRLWPQFGWQARVSSLDLSRVEDRNLASALAEEDIHQWLPDLGIRRVDFESVDGEFILLVCQSYDGIEVRVQVPHWKSPPREQSGEN